MDMSISPEKIRHFKELGFSNDEILRILEGANAAMKTADLKGIAWKAAAPAGDALDPLDEAYVQLRDALDAGDNAGVQQALAQMTTLAKPSLQPAAKVEPHARILTDQGASSVKAYNPATDFLARAFGADQAGRR